MRFTNWIVSALFFVGTYSVAHAQQPTAGASGREPVPLTAPERGTDKDPLTVKIIPAQPTKEQSEQEDRSKREQQEKAVLDKRVADDTQRLADKTEDLAFYTKWLAVFTLFLFVTALGQMLLFWVQLRIMRKSLEDATTAANAATDSAITSQAALESTKDTAKRQLRAYLSITPNTFGLLAAGNHVRITFDAKNHGQTPAFGTSHKFEIDILDNPLPPNFNFPAPTETFNANTSIFPNAVSEVRFFSGKPLTQVDAVEANTKHVHCWGRTSYRDAFGNIRHTSFSASVGGKDFAESQRAFMAGKKGPEWSWDYGQGHNDAT